MRSKIMSLKWGVLGAGSVAQRRAMPAMKKADGAELHALLSRDTERAERLAREHGATHAYTTVDALLADDALNAIYVSTPVYLHREQVIAAAERGLHVLCDKPMALTPQECQEMIAACNANGVHLQLCFLFRFHSCFRQIRTWVDEGCFGQIVHGRMPFLKQYQLAPDEWRAQPEKGGGGCLMDLGPHSVDLLRYLIGEVNAVSAFYNSATQGTRVEETGGIFMRFDNGTQAFTDLSFSVPQCDIVLELYGTEGTVWVYNDDGWKMKVYFGDEKQLIPSQYEDLYQCQFEHFADCVQHGASPITTGVDGLRASEILAAAYRAGETGQVELCPAAQ
jgi:predicted dehydrogenase